MVDYITCLPCGFYNFSLFYHLKKITLLIILYHFTIHLTFESFGWILLNSKLICVISTVLTYLGIWGKRVNFGNTIATIQQK